MVPRIVAVRAEVVAVVVSAAWVAPIFLARMAAATALPTAMVVRAAQAAVIAFKAGVVQVASPGTPAAPREVVALTR